MGPDPSSSQANRHKGPKPWILTSGKRDLTSPAYKAPSAKRITGELKKETKPKQIRNWGCILPCPLHSQLHSCHNAGYWTVKYHPFSRNYLCAKVGHRAFFIQNKQFSELISLKSHRFSFLEDATLQSSQLNFFGKTNWNWKQTFLVKLTETENWSISTCSCINP